MLKADLRTRITPQFYEQYKVSRASPYDEVKPDIFTWNVRGRNPDIDPNSVAENVWDAGGLVEFSSTAETLSIQSTDANDTLAGSGAQKLQLQGMDGNNDLITEIIELDGLTPVVTTKLYLRLFKADLTQGKTNLGDISINTTAGDLPQGFMPTGNGAIKNGWFRIPADYTGFLENLYFESSRDSSNQANAIDYNVKFGIEDGLFLKQFESQVVSDGGPSFIIFGNSTPEISEKTDMIAEVTDTVLQNARVTMFANIILIRNEVLEPKPK